VDTFDNDRTGALTAIFYTDERSEVVWLDPVLKRQQERIDKAVPGNVNRIISASEDRNRMLIWTGAGSRPGVILLLDRTANTMSLFVEPYDKLRDKQLSTMEPVRYKARDGLEIRGYLTLPVGRDPKSLPLIVMPHGGPYARDEAGYDPWVQYLASRGYAVLQPNFRGSTGFGRAFVEKGTAQWGRGMQDDLDDGVKWLAGRGTIDPKRVCIMGASYGGYAAEWAAIRNPDIYRCAVSFAGVSDIASQLRFSRGSFTATRYFSNWRERVQGQKDFDLDQISPLRQAARFGIPILIAHGTEDDRVPISQSRRLHAALLQANRPHDYVEYKGEGHGFENPVNATDFYVRVGAFLDKHNPP
jgi:dipeptidyl aminopeptidase/acylaminoacyl peptidase